MALGFCLYTDVVVLRDGVFGMTFDLLVDAVEALFDFRVENRESLQLRQIASNSLDRGMQTWTSVFGNSRVFCYVLKN